MLKDNANSKNLVTSKFLTHHLTKVVLFTSLFLLPIGKGLTQEIPQALKVLIGCIFLQQVEENLLMPRIMQGSINLNPVVMFFALLVGARIAGLVGVFLAIAITGVLINLFEIQEMQGD